MMAPILRAATIEDLEFLVEVRMEVLDSVFGPELQADVAELTEANRAYYESALPSGEHIACLAFDGEEFLGCGGLCLYREMPSPDNESGRCGYLMNVYTRPQHRRKGVGAAVVEWLVAHAREQGVEKLSLETTVAGQAVYESAGFKPAEGFMVLG